MKFRFILNQSFFVLQLLQKNIQRPDYKYLHTDSSGESGEDASVNANQILRNWGSIRIGPKFRRMRFTFTDVPELDSLHLSTLLLVNWSLKASSLNSFSLWTEILTLCIPFSVCIWIFRKSSNKSRPYIVLGPDFPRLVLEVIQKLRVLEKIFFDPIRTPKTQKKSKPW